MCFRIVFLMFLSFFTTHSFASVDQKYLDYLSQYPNTLGPLGDYQKGELEILIDEDEIRKAEESTGRKVGIVAEDHYWIWLNDALRFPNGTYGVYGRMLWRNVLESPVRNVPGVAVMPILPNGKVALNRNYRHATRTLEYELPRGGLEKRESLEEAAIREVQEETGFVIDEIKLLGMMYPDTGIESTLMPVFMAKVIRQEEAQPQDSEAIESIDAFSIEELKKGLVDGYLTVDIDGKMSQVSLKDPFLSFALLQYLLRQEGI